MFSPVYLAFGANLPSVFGGPGQNIRRAIAELTRAGLSFERTSSFYASPAWPDPADPPFLNAVAMVRTNLAPTGLLRLLHETETAFGRTRSERNAPRPLDIDIVDFDGRVQKGLPVLPHPRMVARAFVLVPLAEISPHWQHPVSGKPIAHLIGELSPQVVDVVKALAANP